MSRIYVGNLDDKVSKREVEQEFETFGPLRDVWVARNPPGFAFVVFEDKRDAEAAIAYMDERYVFGCKIRVEMAHGPTRGGRAARLGITEICYECQRVGHFARNCTRKPGYVFRRRRSRFSSKRKLGYSQSRSRSPKRKRERSRSHERRDYRRSCAPSTSGSQSSSKERQSPDYERSPPPEKEKIKEDKQIPQSEGTENDRSHSPTPKE